MRTKKLIALSFILAATFVLGGCGETSSNKNQEITLVAGFSTNAEDTSFFSPQWMQNEASFEISLPHFLHFIKNNSAIITI